MMHIYASDLDTKLPVFYFTEATSSVIEAVKRVRKVVCVPLEVTIYNDDDVKVFSGKMYAKGNDNE